MRPGAKIPTWHEESTRSRVSLCIMFLHMHGFISDRERDRALERARKWVAKHEASGGAPGGKED